MPELIEGDGFRATLRRPIQSASFTETFGDNMWKAYYTPDDDIGALKIFRQADTCSGRPQW
jgi:hypothetical protein